jgi:dihydrofolate reductase
VTRLSAFIASSIDGYIADSAGELDWLDECAREGEDYGYERFIATVDALAMGRATYDFIAHLDPLPFGDRPVFVFTHRQPPARSGVTFWDASPAQAVQRWEADGFERVYVDGGQLISAFLREGLIDDMLLTTAPVILGSGSPLFVPVEDAAVRHQPLARMRLLETQQFPSGMVNRRYERA